MRFSQQFNRVRLSQERGPAGVALKYFNIHCSPEALAQLREKTASKPYVSIIHANLISGLHHIDFPDFGLKKERVSAQGDHEILEKFLARIPERQLLKHRDGVLMRSKTDLRGENRGEIEGHWGMWGNRLTFYSVGARKSSTSTNQDL